MKVRGSLLCDHANIPSEGLNPLNYNLETPSSAVSLLANPALNTVGLYLNGIPVSVTFVTPAAFRVSQSCLCASIKQKLGVWQPLESQFVVVYAYLTRPAPHGISQRDSSKHVAQHFKWPMKGRQWGALQAVTSNPAFPLGRTWTHTEEFICMWGKNH